MSSCGSRCMQHSCSQPSTSAKLAGVVESRSLVMENPHAREHPESVHDSVACACRGAAGRRLVGPWVVCLLQRLPCSEDMPGLGRSQPTCSSTRGLRRARLPVSGHLPLMPFVLLCSGVTAAMCNVAAHAAQLHHRVPGPVSGATLHAADLACSCAPLACHSGLSGTVRRAAGGARAVGGLQHASHGGGSAVRAC